MDNLLDGIVDNMWGDIFEEPEFYGWTSNLNPFEAKSKLIEYLKVYGPKYDKNNLKFIKENFLTYLERKAPDVRLAQIYSYIGAYTNESDPYIGYVNMLKKYFDIKTDILDVASGDFPAFGLTLAKEQLELKGGTVSLYDPNLVLSKPITKNMKLHKEKFTENTPIVKFSFVTSILPCSVTDLLFNKLLREDKEFFVALCNCFTHGIHGEQIRSHDEIISDVYEKINKIGNGKLIIEHLDSHYRNSLPILIYKK